MSVWWERDIETPLALLVADTDSTQAYVFESAKLPEIRGASRLLDDLNTQEIPLCFQAHGFQGAPIDQGGEIVYAGGGGLAAIVPAGDREQVAALAQGIRSLYPRETLAATITCDWRFISRDMLAEGIVGERGFGGLMRWAGAWLRRRKEDKAPPPFIQALPHATRCQSCQVRPAATIETRPETWALCPVCAAKRAASDRQGWFDVFETTLDRLEAEKAGTIAKYYAKVGTPEAHRPRDLNELGQACRARAGYVGFVYLDGDEFGKLWQQLETPIEYMQTSDALERAMREVVMQTLARRLQASLVTPTTRESLQSRPRPTQSDGKVIIHPFEVITIGGDDVMLIVPAHAALPLAAEIATGFSERIRQDIGRLLTLSAGVVIADDHNPVRILRDLARELLRIAKRDGGGRVDFHVLKSADMLDRKVSRVRRAYPYTLPGDHGGKQVDRKDLRLLGRPYESEQIIRLWKALQELKGVRALGRSQMHQLAESILRGRHVATLFYAYQQGRGGRLKEAYAALDEVLQEIRPFKPDQDPKPWYRLEKDPRYAYATALWDLAELYDFVEADDDAD